MKSVMKNLISSPVVAAILFLIGCIVVATSYGDAQVYKWSETAASNATADPNINWATGMSPSAVSPSARQMMAGIAEVRDDWSGALAGGGTASAYTVTSNQGFDTLAHLNNQQICFTPNNTNAAGVTLAVDGLTALPIDTAPSTAVGAGVLVQGTPYCVIYNNSNQQFYLKNFVGNPYNVPLGGVMIYTGSSAPNSNFVLAFGQCISRTTYAGYFSLVSTTYGGCDGSTTFGVPDLRGRVVAGLDNMGGSSASRLSSICSSTSLGFSCGQQQTNLTSTNQLPQFSITPSGTVSVDSSIGTNFAVPGSGGPFGWTSGSGINGLASAGATASFSGNTISVGSGSPSSFATVQPTLGLTYILRIF